MIAGVAMRIVRDIPALRSMQYALDPLFFNRAQLALTRLANPLELQMDKLQVRLELERHCWTAFFMQHDSLPLIQWKDFLRTRSALDQPVQCTLLLYHYHAWLLFPQVLTEMSRQLQQRLAIQHVGHARRQPDGCVRSATRKPRRENMTEPSASKEFIISRVFMAPRDQLFRAWTMPAQLVRWWGPHGYTNPVCEIDLREGGAYRIVMRAPDGTDYPLKGVYQEISEPARLVMSVDCSEHPSHWQDLLRPVRMTEEANPAGEIVQMVTFESLGDMTLLTVLARFEDARIRDTLLAMGMHEGWSQSLERLAGQLGSS